MKDIMLNRFALIFALLLPPAAFAQTAVDLAGISVDRSAAVEVAADSLEVDQKSGKAVFSGNVVVGQGDLKISAARIEVVYSEGTGDISRLLASGGVTFVTATEAAEAENAIYDIVGGRLILTGDVLLTQGPSAISANEMSVNLTTGAAVLEGRVRTVLQQGGN